MIIVVAFISALAACSPTNDPDATPTTSESDAEARTCAEVRTGIGLFNDGDFAGTVTHFRKAKIPAKAYADASDGAKADDLLEAVDYYSNLAPADYPEAARTSGDFAKYKAITLGQCMPGDGTPDGERTET